PSSYRPLHASPPSPEAIADAVSVLRTSRRPLMLVGGGVTWAGANDLVRQLSADFGWPTITAYGRNDAVPNDDPLYVGPLGRAGMARTSDEWRHEIGDLRTKRHARLVAERNLASSPLKPQRVYAELRGALPPETIVALDAGAAPAYGYDRLHFSRPRTFLTPLDLGTLGFALPAALGAKLARPEAPVLAIHGDGGFLMNVQELETAVRHGINAVTL